MTHPKDGTQNAKVLKALLDANGQWVNGQFFLRQLFLSQYHARIWDLENKFGWTIHHSEEKDEHGFLSYRITERPVRLVPKEIIKDGIPHMRMVPEQSCV